MQVEIGGQKIVVRGLTRGEIKTLRQEGTPITGIEKLGEEEQEKALDRVFCLACPKLDADGITPGEALRLYVKVIELSYAGEDTKKKSGLPPGSLSAAGSPTAESAGKPGSSRKGTARKSRKKHG